MAPVRELLGRVAERLDDARWVVADTIGPYHKALLAGVVAVVVMVGAAGWLAIRSTQPDTPAAAATETSVLSDADRVRCDAWLADLRGSGDTFVGPGGQAPVDGPCGGPTVGVATGIGELLPAGAVDLAVGDDDRWIASAVEMVFDGNVDPQTRAELFDDPAAALRVLTSRQDRAMSAVAASVTHHRGAECRSNSVAAPCAEVAFVGLSGGRSVAASTLWAGVDGGQVTVTVDALCAGAPLWCGDTNRLPDTDTAGR